MTGGRRPCKSVIQKRDKKPLKKTIFGIILNEDEGSFILFRIVSGRLLNPDLSNGMGLQRLQAFTGS